VETSFIILILIALTQNLAVFLDNLGIFYLTKNHKTSRLASVFAKKHQIDFLSRGFLFFTPPLLGFLLTHENLATILRIFVISSFISLIITLCQSYFLIKSFEYKFIFNLSFEKVGIIIFGLLIYSIYLYVPFYLNILAFFFIQQALWIVQLSPVLTVITSIFVVYYMDPRIAKFIDSKSKNKTPSIIFDMVLMRILGRCLILLISLSIYIFFGQ